MKNRFYAGKLINLREAQVNDAEFILNLRLKNQKKNNFLKSIDNDIEKQRKYILDHHNRGDNCYFIIEDKDSEKHGVIRILDVINDSFGVGSFLVQEKAPFYIACSGYLTTLDYGFFKLNKAFSRFESIKTNQSMISLYGRMGAKLINEDSEKVYFTYPREIYIESRKRYLKYTFESKLNL